MISLKNSFFVSLFCAFGRLISNLYNNSCVSRIVEKIYGFFSRLWSNSRIVSVASADNDGAASRSAFGRFLSKGKGAYISFGKWLKSFLAESFVYHAVSSFSKSIISVNTRFFGVMLCSMAAGYSVILIVFGGQPSVYGVAVLAAGTVLSLFNVNISDRFYASGIISGVGKFFNLIPKREKRTFYTNGYALAAAVAVGFIAGVIMYKSLILSILAVAGISGVVFVLMYPVAGAFAAVFVAPFLPTMMLVGVVIFVFMSYLVHSVCACRYPVKVKNVSVALAVFVFVNLVSAIVSFTAVSSLQVFSVSVSLMLIYFVICGTVRDKNTLYAMLRIFVISGAIVALYGIMQYLFGWGLDVKNAWIDKEMFEDATVRVYSTLENPNVLGEYLLLVLFPCLAFVFHSDKWYSKVFYAGLFAVMAICLVLTQSRGCWIGFILGITVYITFIQGRIWGLLPLAIAALPLILPESIIARFSSIGNLEDTSSSYRMYIWLGTIEMLKDFWLFGVGQGQKAFNSVYPFYSYSAITAPHAHNLYLQIFAECGIVAVGTFLTMCVMWFKKIASAFRNSFNKNRLLRGMSIALGGGMLAYLIQSLFDYTFYNYRVVMIFWAVLGMGVAMFNASEVSDD